MRNKENIIPTEFHSDVKKSIKLIENLNSLENDELLKLLTLNGIEEDSAIEIITFLPIAFVRKMLPNVNWRNNYIEYFSDKKQKMKSFAENELYKIIELETENYYSGNPKSENIIKIAGRSAEFKVINDLLLKNENADISEIKLTENVITRTE